MALIICPECGKEISEYANSCIGCGCPMEVIEQLQGTYLQKGMARFLEIVFGSDVYLSTLKGMPDAEYFSVIDDILETLTPREEDMIKLSCGLKDGRVFSHEEIAQKYHLSTERICQYEEKALKNYAIPQGPNDYPL